MSHQVSIVIISSDSVVGIFLFTHLTFYLSSDSVVGIFLFTHLTFYLIHKFCFTSDSKLAI